MAAVIAEVGPDTAGQPMVAGMDVSGPPRSKDEVSVTKTDGNDFASNESYQMVNLLRRLHVSEQKPEPFSGDLSPDSINARLGASARLDPAPQESSKELTSKESTPKESSSQGEGSLGLRLFSVTSPKLVPEPSGSAEAAKAAPKEPTKEAPKAEAGKIVTPRPTRESTIESEAAKGTPKEAEAAKTSAPHATKESMVTSLSADGVYDESWSDDSGGATTPDQDVQISGKRRFVALAAVIALAAVSGAIGGALATAGVGRYLERSNGAAEASTASVPNHAVEDSIARIDAELAALKELGAAQSAKVNDRIDKVEKTLAEPAAKLAKLNEAMDKLRVPPAPAPAPVAAVATPKEPKETTSSIQPPAPAPKPAAARLPTSESWVLRDVANGGALIEGRQGMFEVFAGDPVPGLGRVDAIRRQDGRWVVVTTKGLIVAR